ncbi:MAG: SLBB domain-containing protein [Fibrobacteria bacterium]
MKSTATLTTAGLLSLIVAGMVLTSPTSPMAQSSDEMDLIYEAIRSGKLKVTDELINSQRMLRPELKNLTNEEIKDKLEAKTAASDSTDEADSTESLNREPVKAKPPMAKSWEGKQSADNQTGDSKNMSRFPPDLARFGYDFFNNNQGSKSTSTMPALPEYVLSPGDEITVYTWGRENQSKTIPLDNDGMFHYPPLQPMRLAGMKFSEASSRITAEIEKINGLKASVGMGKLKSIRVMVLGEVASPGSFVIPAGATVTSALFQGGGITGIGSLRGIQLRRGGKTALTLDLYEMLLRGNSKGDAQLVTGDAVFVPVAPIQVGVTGMVKRPAVYEVKPGTKVLEALELAGGLSSNAFKGRVRLDRVEGHSRKVVLDISMEKVGGASNPPIIDGDVLFVDQVLDKEFDVVYLKGNVNRPGRFEFKKGMTVKDLIPTQRDLKSETFFKYGHIKRSAERDERALLIPFSLEDVLDKGVPVALQPRDTVIVYSRFDMMDQPMVKASGMVRKPGPIPFVDQMRVSDLIIACGGLTEEAYLQEAQLLRLLSVEESDSLHYTLLKVNLSGIVDNPGDENNLELRSFDSLIVFPRSNFILPKRVNIYGAVKKSGNFELSKNMGIRELISQADGLTRNSYTMNVEVVRRRIVGDSISEREIHQVSLRDIMEGKSNFILNDGDGVYVREVINSRERSSVSLKGEFGFPGSYEFATGERLSSAIQRAGGFTSHAYLRGAVFIRKSVKEQQIKHVEEIARMLENQMQLLMQRTNDEKERASAQAAILQRRGIIEDIKKAPYLGRVVIKLDKSMKFAGTDWDITLEHGDSLWIGPNPTTVSIMGEVFSPTNVIFTRDANTVGECLGAAGGVTEYGDQSSVYYLLPDGTVKTPRNTAFFTRRNVEAGGSIIVPPKGPKKDYLDALSKITQIIYQIAISVGVAKTVF